MVRPSAVTALPGRKQDLPFGQRRTAPALLLVTFIVLAFNLASAQETASTDVSEASLAELAKVQVYSASEHLEDTRDAPASVTIITADQIQKYGYRTLADILRSVRSFYVTYDRNYSYVGVRGFGRLGDSNHRVLLLVDGHRLNDNVFGDARLGTEFPVDVDLIDRVEIVRGPSSSLYGANAFSAVINVITRKVPQLKGWELSFDAGSFAAYKGRVSYAGRYKGAEMLFSTTLYNSQGEALFFPEFNSPSTNGGITAHTDFETHEQSLATISFRGFTFQGMFSTRDKGNPTAYYGVLFNDPRTRNYDDDQYFDLGYEHSIAGDWRLKVRTAYDQNRLEAPLAYSADAPDKYSTRGNWWTSDASLNRTLMEKHSISFGLEVTRDLLQDQGDYTAATNLFVTTAAQSNLWALYTQDQFSINPKLSLSAGIRYDHYSEFGGTTNPRLGLIYHPFAPTTFKVVYGSAFRAPEPFETIPDFSFYESNPSLKPESIHSIEGIVEQNLGHHFAVSGSVFRNWIQDLISLDTDPSNNLAVYRNSGKVDATGVEAEVDGRFPGGLEGRASYSFTSTKDAITSIPLSNSPQHLGKLNLIVPLQRRKLFASLDAQYTSPAQTLAGNTVSGFSIFNVTVLGHTLGKHLDLSGSFYNILNKKYFDPGRPEDVEDVIQQDGRTFRVKITGRF